MRFRPGWMLASLVLGVAAVGIATRAQAGEPRFQGFGERADTPVTRALLDPDVYAEALDAEHEGGESPLAPRLKGDAQKPTWVVHTRDGSIGHGGVAYGLGKNPGPRRLRIGFREPVAVGTVVALGNGALAFLKPDAEYPGRLDADEDWIPAQRLDDDQRPVASEPATANAIVGWVAPPGLKTRALRFTHTPGELDADFTGRLGGVLVLSGRYENLAPRARPVVSDNPGRASRLVNGLRQTWGAWDNRSAPAAEKDRQVLYDNPAIRVVSPEHPVRVLLAWPEAVSLAALVTEFGGFTEATVERFVGPDGRHPADALHSVDPADWAPVATYDRLTSGYAGTMTPGVLRFPEPVTTRAVRLTITRADAYARHPHVVNKTLQGRRVWLDEIFALRDLADQPLPDPEPADDADNVEETPPPIAVRFTLPEDGFVTLVIEDERGDRVRNLIAETPFPAGEHTVGWDASDDLARDRDAAMHGLYRIPTRPVAPGAYRVRGLWRKAVSATYERCLYREGQPPWPSADNTGGWLADHSPPQSALFVPADDAEDGRPAVWLGCFVVEGGHGLIRVGMDGDKITGRRWIGGNWTGAPYLARDAAPRDNADGQGPVPAHAFYAASAFRPDRKKPEMEIRLTPFGRDGHTRPSIKHIFVPADAEKDGDAAYRAQEHIGGLAVRDGIAVVSMTRENRLLVVDVRTGDVRASIPAPRPLGLAFDAQGALLAVLDGRLVATKGTWRPDDSPFLPLVRADARDGDQPRQLAFDPQGRLYVGFAGTRNNVVRYTRADDGTLRPDLAFGEPGPSAIGPYNPRRMNQPAGLAVDVQGRLWVAEYNYVPKRVSVWRGGDASLDRAFYGPGQYGGGGVVDSRDPARAYYADGGSGTMAFRLDEKTGRYVLESVLYRRPPGDTLSRTGHHADGAPQSPLYVDGRRYFTNAFNSNPVSGAPFAMIHRENPDGTLVPTAAFGDAARFPPARTPALQRRRAELAGQSEEEYQQRRKKPAFHVLWVDLDGDGQAQENEIELRLRAASGITVLNDLSFAVARLGEQTVVFAPVGFTDGGVPRYDLDHPRVLFDKVLPPGSSGGNQALFLDDDGGWGVVTLGYGPFERESIAGGRADGTRRWSIPSPWPGLHASHRAPRPNRPGQLIGTTRLLGDFFRPGDGREALWALNSNHGQAYVFTRDGLLVATLFEDMRMGRPWRMSNARTGLSLNGITLGDENFWPSITATPDGRVYMVDGRRSAVVRLEGLDSVRRLPDIDLTVTPDDLLRVEIWRAQRETARRERVGGHEVTARLPAAAPVVDGLLDDWHDARWVDIDRSGTSAYFNANTRPYRIQGALAVADGRLFAAWRTGDPRIALNQGDVDNALFKSGGALDLMLGTRPDAPADRTQAAEGDLRLLFALVPDAKTKRPAPRALLYRPVVEGATAEDRVPFASPWRTVTFDRVEDVTAQVAWAADDRGNYELSVPLSVLGVDDAPVAGTVWRGDLGVLRGQDGVTTARVYWSNKATAIVSDVPSEALLAPHLWGTIRFEP